MKIELRETKTAGVVQITTYDERWYLHPDHPNKPFSSWTWVAGYYPKGIGFYKWLADKGWNEAESIKHEKGEKGSRVHKGIEILVAGNPLKINDSLPDANGDIKEFTVEEWEALMSFHGWYNEVKPEILQTEQDVYDEELWHAGTLDLKAKINGLVTIIDIKTSAQVYASHEIQVMGYKRSKGNEDVQKMAILQVGYRTKKGWKWNEVEDRPELVLAAHNIWKYENENKQPPQKDYPVLLTLNGEANANK